MANEASESTELEQRNMDLQLAEMSELAERVSPGAGAAIIRSSHNNRVTTVLHTILVESERRDECRYVPEAVVHADLEFIADCAALTPEATRETLARLGAREVAGGQWGMSAGELRGLAD